jgi:hypothetical protein
MPMLFLTAMLRDEMSDDLRFEEKALTLQRETAWIG